jgi:hypothetical protein
MSENYLQQALTALKQYAHAESHDGNWNLALAAEEEHKAEVMKARAEGYAQAREQAALVAARWTRGIYLASDARNLPDSIRAMRPEEI